MAEPSNKNDRHNRVLVYGLPTQLLGSLLLLLSQHLNTLLLPPLLPGALPPSPDQLIQSRIPVNVTVLLSVTADKRLSLAEVRKRYNPHIAILALRHPAHACIEIGALNKRSSLWHQSKIETMDFAYRSRRANFDQLIVLEELAMNRREPLRFLKRLGYSKQSGANMLMFPRTGEEVMQHSFFHCGPYCRDRSSTNWNLIDLKPLAFENTAVELAIRSKPTLTKDVLELGRKLAPSIAQYYDIRYPELGMTDVRVIKMWLRSMHRLMTLVDARSYFSPPISAFSYDIPSSSSSSSSSITQNVTHDVNLNISFDANGTLANEDNAQQKVKKRRRRRLQFNEFRANDNNAKNHQTSSRHHRGDVMEEYEKFKLRKQHQVQVAEASQLEESARSRIGKPLKRYPQRFHRKVSVGHDLLNSHSSSSSLLGGSEVVVVAAGDDSWRSLMMNWASSLDRLKLPYYILFAADEKVHKYLTSIGAPSFFYSSIDSLSKTVETGESLNSVLKIGKDRSDEIWSIGESASLKEKAVRWHKHGKMWWFRWRFISEILKRGVDVIHSDIDAIWLKNPLPLLAYSLLPNFQSSKTFNRQEELRRAKLLRSSSMVASRGSTKPHWLLCMGWLNLRATPQILDMLPIFLRNLKEIGDDQRAWNMAMDSQGHMSWRGNPYHLKNEDTFLMGSTNQGLVVSLLPNSAIRRTGCSVNTVLYEILNNETYDEYADILKMKRVNTSLLTFNDDDDEENNADFEDEEEGKNQYPPNERLNSLSSTSADIDSNLIDQNMGRGGEEMIMRRRGRRLAVYQPAASDLFVAHCREIQSSGQVQSSLTQNSSAVAKVNGLRQLGLWALPADWSAQVALKKKRLLESNSDQKVSMQESEASKLAKLIVETNPNKEESFVYLHQSLKKHQKENSIIDHPHHPHHQNQHHDRDHNNPLLKNYGKDRTSQTFKEWDHFMVTLVPILTDSNSMLKMPLITAPVTASRRSKFHNQHTVYTVSNKYNKISEETKNVLQKPIKLKPNFDTDDDSAQVSAKH